MAGGGFAALFGANAGHDQLVDTLLVQPNTQASPDQRAMARLLKFSGRGEVDQAVDWPHMARFDREGVVFVFRAFHMQDADNRHIGLHAGGYQSIAAVQESLRVFVAPVGAQAEGLLNVDEQQGGLHEELLVLKAFTLGGARCSVAPDGDRNQSKSDIDSLCRGCHSRESGNRGRSHFTPPAFQVHSPVGFPLSRE